MIKLLATHQNRCHEFLPEELPTRLQDQEQVLWIDITQPSPSEIAFLRREFQFHELALEDAAYHNQRAKIDEYDNFYFLVVHTAHSAPPHLAWDELDIFIGVNYLVTLHEDGIPVVGETQKRWTHNPSIAGKGAGELLYVLLDAIVDQYFPIIDDFSDRVENLEEAIFGNTTVNTLSEIFALRKEMMQLRRNVAPAREIVNSLLRRDVPVINEALTVYYQDVYDHMLRIIEQVDTLRDVLNGALDAHLAVASNKLNQTMQRLTGWTIILMSMALITGVYGMNFEFMPELKWELGYPLALDIMAFIAVALYIALKRLRWL